MTRNQALNYIQNLMTKDTYKAIMKVMKYDKLGALDYLKQMGIKEEILNLL